MKIMIMSAGRGTRISRHIMGRPKCTIDVKGSSLIKRTFNVLHRNDLKDVSIVLGYEHHFIEKEISSFKPKIYLNPFFDVTNSIASLWFARDFISPKEDLIIMNGDLFIEDEVINTLLSIDGDVVMLGDSSRIREADYKFNWDSNMFLRKFGKDLLETETTGEYVGVAKISRHFIDKFMGRMNEMINSQQHGKWWEDILYSFVKDNKNILIKDINGLFWAEVDYVEDYERIIKYVNERGIK